MAEYVDPNTLTEVMSEPTPEMGPPGGGAVAAMPQMGGMAMPQAQLDPTIMGILQLALQQQQAAPAPAAPTMDPQMAAMLQAMLTRPTTTMNPRLAQMQAFMQMQQANPGRGPFSALVNPIMNALMARQMGPQLQQQQEDAAMMQRLKVMDALAKYQTGVSTQGLNVAKTEEIRGKMADANSPLGKLIMLTKAGLSPTVTDTTNANIAGTRIAASLAMNAATNQTRATIANVEQSQQNARTMEQIKATKANVDAEIKARKENVATEQGGAMARAQFTTGVKEDLADLERQRKEVDAAQKYAHWGHQDAMDAGKMQIAIENMKTDLEELGIAKVNSQQLVTRTLMMGNREQRLDTAQKLQAVYEQAKTMSPEEGRAFMRSAAGPLFTQLTGQDYKMVDPQSFVSALINLLGSAFGAEPSRTISTVTPATPGQVPTATPNPWQQPPALGPQRTIPQISIPPAPVYGQPTPQMTAPPPTTVPPPMPGPPPTGGVGMDYFQRLKQRSQPYLPGQ